MWNRRGLFCRKTSPAETPPSQTFPFLFSAFQTVSQCTSAPKPSVPKSNNSSSSSPLQPKPEQVGVTTGRSAYQSKTSRTEPKREPCYTTLLSAGGCGDGLLQLLAADLAGAGLQEQVVADVADQHRVIQLLVWDGQLQMTTVFTEHIATVPVEGDHTGSC